jgi:hypothetical protein
VKRKIKYKGATIDFKKVSKFDCKKLKGCIRPIKIFCCYIKWIIPIRIFQILLAKSIFWIPLGSSVTYPNFWRSPTSPMRDAASPAKRCGCGCEGCASLKEIIHPQWQMTASPVEKIPHLSREMLEISNSLDMWHYSSDTPKEKSLWILSMWQSFFKFLACIILCHCSLLCPTKNNW